MNMTDQLNALAGNASCITLAVHTHPDGDAVGSGTGMLSYLLECKGADAVLVFPDRVPDSLSFMLSGIDPGRLMTFGDGNPQAAGRIARSDLLVCLDCSSFSRTAGLESLLRESGAKKVLIDHHLDPERDAFDLVFSETETSSASELLYSILLRMPEIAGDPSRLPPLCASALMTGMTTDTNNFSNSVFPSTLKMASELIAAGVDRDSILESLYSSYRENRLRLLGCLLGEKMQITPEGVAFIVLDSRTQERFGMVQGETEGFVNMPLSIGAGASGVCKGAQATNDEYDYVVGLFGCLGRAVPVDESDMDIVCALSGSGPAYVAAMIEALRDAAAAQGLDEQLAETLALQTVLGTARLIDETPLSPAVTREAVCSPGGTTLAALDAMYEAGFNDVFQAGVDAAVRRSKELAQS